MQKKVLGVLGGLGPMASVYFYELVTAHTKAKTDQQHIDIILSSKATTPDRTAFILGRSKDDPFAVMEAEAQRLVAFGADILAIPCNTAHYFYERLNAGIPIPVLNMVGGTVSRAKNLGAKKIGVLATDGTVQTGTYQRVCRELGVACAVPDEAGQRAIMDIIYGEIKQGKPASLDTFLQVAEALFLDGCDRLVLGCTELSLVKKQAGLDARYLDSMEILAEAAIRACGGTPTGFTNI